MASRLPPLPAVPGPALRDEEFRRFCDFVYRRTGMSFGEGKRYFVDRRVADRMAATGEASFAGYFALLLTDAGEVERLVNAFTVNETYFYREEHQFRCLTSSLLGQVTAARRPGSTVRIWSVPCATGEEPYSLAIWLLENWPPVDSWDVEIVGSDIDTDALRAAEAGLYASRALMRLPPLLVGRYFTAEAEGRYRLVEDLRGSVRFTPVNVMDRVAVASHGLFDVIFCRNMLIYFDDRSRREAAEALYDSLVPGGFICLGHTESMSRISPLFKVCRFDGAIVYQKPRGDHDG